MDVIGISGVCVNMFAFTLHRKYNLGNVDAFNCASILISGWFLKPSLACFCRIHHRIYWVLLSQSTQLVHQQRPAQHWGWHAWMAHRSQRKSSIRLPQWLWAGPHPPSFSEQPADFGGPSLHQESDAATQSVPHAQIRFRWVFKVGICVRIHGFTVMLSFFIGAKSKDSFYSDQNYCSKRSNKGKKVNSFIITRADKWKLQEK